MWIPFHFIRLIHLKVFLGHLGECVSISRNVDLRNMKHIYIGNHTIINSGCILDARGGNLSIGNNVDIAQDTFIWTLQHDYNDDSHRGKGANIDIEDYVWIGARSNILPGVLIAKGAVIGTCSVVTKKVEAGSVVVGVPAKKVAERRNSYTYTLNHRMWFD